MNHFVRRYNKRGENTEDSKTSENFYGSNVKQEVLKHPMEGGEIMSNMIFGENLIALDIFRILYVLNFKNWEKSLDEFKTGFSECKKINVDECIENMKDLLDEDFTYEIKELVTEASETAIISQTVYNKFLDYKKNPTRVEVGRCLISIGREKNKNYNL